MKIMWILLAVRLLIPYNFSIVPLAGISFAGAAPSDSWNAGTDAAVHLDLSQAADGSSQQDISAGIPQSDAAQMIHGQPFRKTLTTLADSRNRQIRSFQEKVRPG